MESVLKWDANVEACTEETSFKEPGSESIVFMCPWKGRLQAEIVFPMIPPRPLDTKVPHNWDLEDSAEASRGPPAEAGGCESVDLHNP